MNAEEKELLEIVGKASIANELLHGEQGKLLKDTSNIQVERALKTLCFSELTERQRDILIERIRFLKFELFNGLNKLASDGELAYQDLTEVQQLRESDSTN